MKNDKMTKTTGAVKSGAKFPGKKSAENKSEASFGKKVRGKFAPRDKNAGKRDSGRFGTVNAGKFAKSASVGKTGGTGDAGAAKYSEYTRAIAAKHNFADAFPPGVLRRAAAVPQTVPRDKYAGRRDLRNEVIITIDGEDAKDLDDAVSLTMTEDGLYLLGVHIADASEYAAPNSELDAEALRRGTSLYFPGEVRPMLPPELSNGVCSLHPGADKLALSVFMHIDGAGVVVAYEICESVINTRERMTYTDVNKILAGDRALNERYAHIAEMLRLMEKLMRILSARRRERGAIDFDLPEPDIKLDGAGLVVSLECAERGVANKTIEEFMVLCNETVAEYARGRNLPFIYRVHEKPSAVKSAALLELLKSLNLKGARLQNLNNGKAIADLLRRTADLPQAHMINRTALRSMMKAEYRPENLGHFGLAAEFYCHFTSPIRRYPDLFIHRVLKLSLRGALDARALKSLSALARDAAAGSSEREAEADCAEREADDVYKAAYMRRFYGEEFDARVSGVTAFGVFAELPNTAEGLIRIENLNGRFHFNKEKSILYSPKGGASYRLGDPLRVVVARCDEERGRIEFMLPPAAPAAPRRASR